MISFALAPISLLYPELNIGLKKETLNEDVAKNNNSSSLKINAIKKKWQDLGLKSEWVNQYYEDVAYLVKTQLIYSIIGFQNSTIEGKNKNEIKIAPILPSNRKGLWIKKQGQWTSISKIRDEIKWNTKELALVSKNCQFEKWSYFSDQGLTPIHKAHNIPLANDPNYPKVQAKMHPVTKLSMQEMNDLLDYAKQFEFKCKQKKDLGSIRGAIQFVTHPNSTYKHPLLQNLNMQMSVHCGIRLITPDRAVYSFGFGGDFNEHSLKKRTFESLATINGQPKILDYMEFKKYEQRFVTTVPLNELQANKILDQLNFYRKNGVRFNILKQNCVRFATHLLHYADISLNTRVSLLTTGWRSMPSVEHIPRIGKSLVFIKNCGEKVWRLNAEKIPLIIRNVLISIANGVFYLPAQLLTLIQNLGLIVIGGKLASSNYSLDLKKSNASENLENFDCLVSNLFDKESLYIHHSSNFIDWQLNQKTTKIYHYSGQPAMNILPYHFPRL